MDMEADPADVARFRIRYRLGTAKFGIALSALYQLLLLNPKRGCSILSGLREWERSRRLTDFWAANTPCYASLGDLGWEGFADEQMLLSRCGLNAPSPHSASPAKPHPFPPTNPNPPPCPPPPQTHRTQNPPPHKRKSFKSSSSSSRQALPCAHGKGVKGKPPQEQKRREEPPSLEGDGSPDPCLVHKFVCPTPMVSTRGL